MNKCLTLSRVSDILDDSLLDYKDYSGLKCQVVDQSKPTFKTFTQVRLSQCKTLTAHYHQFSFLFPNTI